MTNIKSRQIKYYLVGGAVRDKLLGLPVRDKDWVVTGAEPQTLPEAGFRAVGKDFPVFLHPETHEEYALARTERKTAAGYHGFQFYAAPTVTLEEDLLRRDLTINALAEDENGRLIDVNHGLQDLEQRILRHVSPAFAEDPVRILRVARFAARFAPLGFTIAPETMQLMRRMVTNGEVNALVAERVWQETARALTENTPARYIEVLRECGALSILFPEIDRLFGIPQVEKYHPEIDTGVHTLMTLERAATLSTETCVRFAALTHDLGKGTTPQEEWPKHINHEQRGVPLVKQLAERYRIPNHFRQLAELAAGQHLRIHRAQELRATTLVKLLESCDAFRKPERFAQLLLTCQADAQGRSGMSDKPYPQAEYLSRMLQSCQQIDTQSIIQQGFKGQQIREQVYQARVSAVKKQMQEQT